MNKEITQILYDFSDSNDFSENKLKKLLKDLKTHLPNLKKIRSELMAKENDFRNGFETYKYESIEHICINLDYISDRWMAAFRVNWLIGLLDPSDEFHQESYKTHKDVIKHLRSSNGN